MLEDWDLRSEPPSFPGMALGAELLAYGKLAMSCSTLASFWLHVQYHRLMLDI